MKECSRNRKLWIISIALILIIIITSVYIGIVKKVKFDDNCIIEVSGMPINSELNVEIIGYINSSNKTRISLEDIPYNTQGRKYRIVLDADEEIYYEFFTDSADESSDFYLVNGILGITETKAYTFKSENLAVLLYALQTKQPGIDSGNSIGSKIIDLTQYPGDSKSITQAFKADLNDDGINEFLYNSTDSSGMPFEFVECYDCKSQTYSYIEEQGKNEIQFIQYDSELYIYTHQPLYRSCITPSRIYKPILENGELSYQEIDDLLQKEILENLYISKSDEYASNIISVSLYDYEISGDIPVVTFDNSHADILNMIANLHESTKTFRDDVGTTHLRRAAIEYVDEKQLDILFGTQGFMTILDNGKQYNAQNEELEEYLTELMYEYGDYGMNDELSVKRFNALIENIVSSPKESSNAYDYIAEHQDDYDEIIGNMNTMIYDYIKLELINTSNPTLRTRILQVIYVGDLESTVTDMFSIVHTLNKGKINDSELLYYQFGEKVDSIEVNEEIKSIFREIECTYGDTFDMYMRSTGTPEFYMLNGIKIYFIEDKACFTVNNIMYTYTVDKDSESMLKQIFNNHETTKDKYLDEIANRDSQIDINFFEKRIPSFIEGYGDAFSIDDTGYITAYIKPAQSGLFVDDVIMESNSTNNDDEPFTYKNDNEVYVLYSFADDAKAYIIEDGLDLYYQIPASDIANTKYYYDRQDLPLFKVKIVNDKITGIISVYLP